MQRSTDRILTTHAGSLPRPKDLEDMIWARHTGVPVDQKAFANRVAGAVTDIVKQQQQTGIDIVDDGEVGKVSFVTYVIERLEGVSPKLGSARSPWANSREMQSFPEFYSSPQNQGASGALRSNRMVCTGPLKYKGHNKVKTDIKNLKAALKAAGLTEGFIPCISPTNVEDWIGNEYYKTQDDYLYAVADAMHEEYKAVADAGLIVQIDDPRLVTYYITHPERSVKQCRAWAESRVEALNHALRGIPEGQIRFHTCYSINMGPRVHDMELKDIVDIILKINAGAYSFEAANPRHDHEWRVWRDVKIPNDRILIPGLVTHSSVLVEHPQLVADRIMNFASVVGKERVIAGTDCGFATFAGQHEIHPSIAWAKLKSLADGAKIASRQLWSKRAR